MTAEDVDRWLEGSSVEDAPAMQKPEGDDSLKVGPLVKPERKAAWQRVPAGPLNRLAFPFRGDGILDKQTVGPGQSDCGARHAAALIDGIVEGVDKWLTTKS